MYTRAELHANANVLLISNLNISNLILVCILYNRDCSEFYLPIDCFAYRQVKISLAVLISATNDIAAEGVASKVKRHPFYIAHNTGIYCPLANNPNGCSSRDNTSCWNIPHSKVQHYWLVGQ